MCKSDISEENTSQTTMMIRNIPCRYLDDDVQNILDEIGFKDTFNFVFTPCKGRSNLGYTFVDFKTPELAAELKRRLAGQAFGGRHDHKYCDVVPAHLQGAIANKFAKRSRKAEKIRIESVQDDLFFGANLIGIDPVAPGAWGDDLALSGSGLKGSQAAQDYYRIPGTVPPAGLPPSPAGIRRPPGAWARPPPPSLPHRCVPQGVHQLRTDTQHGSMARAIRARTQYVEEAWDAYGANQETRGMGRPDVDYPMQWNGTGDAHGDYHGNRVGWAPPRTYEQRTFLWSDPYPYVGQPTAGGHGYPRQGRSFSDGGPCQHPGYGQRAGHTTSDTMGPGVRNIESYGGQGAYCRHEHSGYATAPLCALPAAGPVSGHRRASEWEPAAVTQDGSGQQRVARPYSQHRQRTLPEDVHQQPLVPPGIFQETVEVPFMVDEAQDSVISFHARGDEGHLEAAMQPVTLRLSL